jgi:mRNA-degrading endonuclease RelE of RelBE toxin-antitoxin system
MSATYRVIVMPSAHRELIALRTFDQRKITAAMGQQLRHEPNGITQNRKRLDAVCPAFEHVPPLWELRVGQFRVFYDISDEEAVVRVRAVRLKGAGQTTEDIIS